MTKPFLGTVLLTLFGACVAGAQTGAAVFSEAFANAAAWRPWPGDQTLIIDQEVFHSGTGSLRVAAPASTAYTYWDLKPQMRYRLTAWVKIGGSGTAKSKFHVKFNKDGISKMSLLDLLEMLADWKAATARHSDGSLFKSFEINRERFGIPRDLFVSLVNTAYSLTWLTADECSSLLLPEAAQ